MNFHQKGFANVILVAVIVVLLGAVGYFVFVKKPWPTPTSTPIPDGETTDWRIYRADKYGVSFSYPPNFRIVTDKIQVEYIGHPNGFNWYRIELTDTSATEKPFMRFEIDPDGYGPFFPDKIYQVTENSDGKIVIGSVNIGGSENSSDGKVLIIPNVLESSNGHSYYWQFSYNESGKDHEPLFKQILSTFRFLGRPEGNELTKEVVLSLLKNDLFEECRPERIVGKYGSCAVDISEEAEKWVVVVIYDGLYDDSAKATRIQTTVMYQNGQWAKGSVSKTQQCWPGRGHQDFSAEACL